jgi:hypothetical protein
MYICDVYIFFYFLSFLGAFAKSRNSGYELHHVCVSICAAVRTQQLASHCMDFHEVSNLSIFRNSIWKIQASFTCDTNKWYFIYMNTYVHL